MTSRELNKDLLLNFPELKEKFEEETSWQEGYDTGSFIVFEDVFMPFLNENIMNNNDNELDKIFNYIEKLSLNEDEYVQNIVYVAILENISTFSNKDEYIKHFKNNTKNIFDSNYRK